MLVENHALNFPKVADTRPFMRANPVSLGLVALGVTAAILAIAVYLFRNRMACVEDATRWSFFRRPTQQLNARPSCKVQAVVGAEINSKDGVKVPSVPNLPPPESVIKKVEDSSIVLSDNLSQNIYTYLSSTSLSYDGLELNSIRVSLSGELLLHFNNDKAHPISLSSEKLHLVLTPEFYRQVLGEAPHLKPFFDALFEPTEAVAVEDFCFKNEEEAKRALILQGQKPGDFAIGLLDWSQNQYKVYFLNEQNHIAHIEISNPYIWNGNIYKSEIDQFRNPILPEKVVTTSNKTILRHIMINWRHKSLFQELECCSHISNSEDQFVKAFYKFNWVGCQKELLAWLDHLRQSFAFSPAYFLKVFSHHLGLSGRFFGLNMEGFTNRAAMCELLDNGIDFLTSVESRGMPERLLLLRMCQAAVRYNDRNDLSAKQAMLKELNENLPVTIATGWLGHSVNVTLSHNYLVYTNRGARSCGDAGSIIYRITKPVTTEILGKIQEASSEKFFTEDLIRELGLEKVAFIEAKDQGVGNCAIANNKAFLKSALMILQLEKGAYDVKLGQSAKAHHRQFSKFIRESQIKGLLIMLKRGKFNPQEMKNILTLLLFAMIKFSIPKALSEAIWLQLACLTRNNDFTLVVLLVRLSSGWKISPEMMEQMFAAIDKSNHSQLYEILLKKGHISPFNE